MVRGRADRRRTVIHPPTPDQSAGANPQVSSWVTASAGSGKTRVLADRVLRLLLADARPEGILCLTFTKAAAAEMTQRITDALSRWATASDDALAAEISAMEAGAGTVADATLARAHTLLAAVPDASSGIRVQTIHAFCQSLLARFPLESGVAAHFQVADERTAAEMLADARDVVLRRSGADGLRSAVEVLAARWNEGQAADVLRTLNTDRARIRRLLASGVEPAMKMVCDRLALAIEDTEESILNAACAGDAPSADALGRVAEALTAADAKTHRERGRTIADWLAAAPAERRVGFDLYASAYLTKQGVTRERLVPPDVRARIPDADAVLAREAERLAGVRGRQRAADTRRATEALLRFVDAMFAEYDRIKVRHARLDYDDLILRAGALLGRPGIGDWVQFKLDGGIDHVLIDEAQDTSPDQWDVIDRLTGEFFAGLGARGLTRTVFAVGDPKQSIYGFRHADPEAFARWREEFGARVRTAEQEWHPRDLRESFRSTEPILEAVDAVFASDDARRGLLFGADTVRHVATRQDQAGCVELWNPEQPAAAPPASAWEPPHENEERRTPSARLAARIAARIRAWQDQGERLPARDRAVRPGDIMILVQRRTAFVDEMIRELKHGGIPVAGIDRMVITAQLPVMDLLALVRFVLWPEDDLNLAAVLKGPFVGLSEDELFALAHGRRGNLWRALRARADDDLGCAAAVRTLSAHLRRADTVPPHGFLADLLANGGRRRLLARMGPEANDPVDELLARALDFERTHAPSLQGFLRWIEAGQTEVKREQEPGRDEVRVMTVHGAKGLQAPIVFLPDSIRVAAVPEPVLWDDGADVPVLLWPRSKHESDATSVAARERGGQRQDEEYRRLLYVAMTRAEDRLIVCGWDTKVTRRAGNWYDRIEAALESLDRGREDLPGGVRRWSCPQRAAPDRCEPRGDDPMAASPLPPWARARAPSEPTDGPPLLPSRPDGTEPPAFSPIASGGGLRRGGLIHRLLQLLPDLPEHRRGAAATRFLAAIAADMPDSDRAEMVVTTLAVLAEAAWAPVFGPESRGEVPVAGRIGDVVLSGRIDRLVVRPREILMVDYKTHRPAPRTAPPLYLRQMAAYRAALRRVYPDRSARCALLWTDGPSWMELDAAALDSCRVSA